MRTFIAPSRLEGVGVFAADPIPAGTVIWRFDPDWDRLIPRERHLSAPPVLKELLDRYAYPSPGDPGTLVFEPDNGRFMNHSDRPNTDFSHSDRGTARHDIAAGEEITCDYGEFFDGFELLPSAAAG